MPPARIAIQRPSVSACSGLHPARADIRFRCRDRALFTVGRSARLQADRGREQIPSLHRIGRRHTRGAKNRRRDIRQAHGFVARRRGHAGRRDDERHAQRRVVRQHAVGALAVIAEPLAVVAGDDDHRAIELARARSASSSRASCASAYAISASYGVARARAIFGRRLVRGVRIVEVDQRKKAGGAGDWAAWWFCSRQATRARGRRPLTPGAPLRGVRWHSDRAGSDRRTRVNPCARPKRRSSTNAPTNAAVS